jgi:SH3 domain-containing YSC84-like protein 1
MTKQSIAWRKILSTSLAFALMGVYGWAQDNSNNGQSSESSAQTQSGTDQAASPNQNTPTTTDQNTPTTTERPANRDSDRDTPATQENDRRQKNNDKDTAKFDRKDSKNETDVEKRLDTSASVLNEIMGTPDKGIPKDIMADAKCLVVIPSMVHIAVGFGGRHGRGVSTCRTTNGWSAPAPIDITGGSWGLQLGGQATDIVMVVMNQKGMDALLSNKFKVGAEISGAAGPVGRQMEGSTDWKFKSEVLTYSRSRGLFAGIDLNGASIKQDKDSTAVLYGKVVPFETILSGKVAAPESAHTFLATVRKYAQQAKEQKQGE